MVKTREIFTFLRPNGEEVKAEIVVDMRSLAFGLANKAFRAGRERAKMAEGAVIVTLL